MDITRGFTFSDTSGNPGNVCSATNIHTMVDSATFANMVLGDFSSTQKPIYISGSAPSSPIVGQAWFQIGLNTAANPMGILLGWNGAQWIPLSEGFIGKSNTDTIVFGDAVKLLVPDNTYHSGYDIELADNIAGSNLECGFAAQDIAINSTGIITTRGFAIAKKIIGTSVMWGYCYQSNPTQGSILANTLNITPYSFARMIDPINGLVFVTGILKFSP